MVVRLYSLCVLVVVFASQLILSLSLRTDLCQDGHFYSLIDNRCKKCSTCPTNQIIKHPCTKYADLKCGPFKFNDFPDVGNELSYQSPGDDLFDENYYYTLNVSKKKNRAPARAKSHNEEMENPTTIEKEDREYWKTLAFALIGLLSVLIIVATVVVLLACRKLQRATVIKQPDDGDMDDADSGYVVIRAIRLVTDTRPGNTDRSFCTKEEYAAHPPLLGPTSSDTDLQSVLDPPTTNPHTRHLCFLPQVYKPQRRLLNYDADDVFESDDSGSSFILPGKTKLQTIAEKSLDVKINGMDNVE
uniref:TNFR-Cys domain-containing protein n=1 Tax=Arion vulgaris TaxID=1028688 RepID=A0A0B6YZT1_9EUPU